MRLRTVALILLAIWLLLVLLGKSGFIHLMLLSGIVIIIIDFVERYRSREVIADSNSRE